jgi:hypothetical protein
VITDPHSKPSPKKLSLQKVTTTFPEDLGISAVSKFMSRKIYDHSTDMEEDDEHVSHIDPVEPLPVTTTIIAEEPPQPNRFRLNLIRHKFATSTTLNTLQLFKAFVTAAKSTDKTLIILPVDSTKQNLTPLTTQKQIDQLTPNQLRLYFSPWFKDQHFSISGFIHLSTNLTLEQLETNLPLSEWLVTYQYSIKLCKSQEEEMSIIGALCYGSLFIYREGLLNSILSHPSWIALNQDREKPIAIDLIVKPFKSPGQSEEMIFVKAECLKKEIVRDFFLELYDGTPKKYPRGDMLFFIPVASKLEVDYTDAQRAKYLFNHKTYIGEEDCTAIFGLANLENEITLKDGSIITVRTLLKSLPASPGLTRSRLFQVVDPDAAQTCTLVTFQRCDHPLVEDRKFALEKEILSHLAPDQASKVFADEFEGIKFVGAYHKNKGKVIRVQNHSKAHLDFIQHADNLLSSPPKKRTHTVTVNPTPSRTYLHPLNTNLSYSGAVQAQTTHIKSVAVQQNGNTLTTTMQMSQTVMAVMETCFHTIEQEQHNMKQHIEGVENKASYISENIQAMMAHWSISPANYKRKLDTPPEERDMEHVNHSKSTAQGPEDKCF